MSIWQLLIILVIVVMLFGTKRLKNLGSDLGDSIKGFRKSMNSDESENQSIETTSTSESQPIDIKAKTVNTNEYEKKN
ncbi:UNVERIFIED_CONTAM: hypothetical protein GTU68_023870 [Idotea baltica]|nr:hypothetical protein [Idotea baltica]